MALALDDPRDIVLQIESGVSAAIFSTSPGGSEASTRVASASDAILAAAAAAREGRRATAVLSPSEVLAAVDALHTIARRRAPIVVHVAGERADRSAAAHPGRDEIAPLLDAGAGVLVTWSAQESIDLALAARRAAEDAETPFVLVSDAGGPMGAMPGSDLIDAFLGAKRRIARHADGAAAHDVDHVGHKRSERSFAARVPFALASAMRELGDRTGRPLAPIERCETADAEEIVVAVGQGFAAARAAASAMRREGRHVGAVGVRALRPFFPAELVKAVARARAVAVIEPLDIALAPCGPLATALKAAFADALTWAPGFPGVGRIPPIVSVVFATIDGAVNEREVRQALAELPAGDRARRLIVFGSDAAV